MSQKQEKKYKESDVMVLLESMNNRIEIIGESRQQLQTDMTEVKKNVAKMQKNMADIKGELSDIKYKPDGKVSYDDFQKLEKRVLRLENTSA